MHVVENSLFLEVHHKNTVLPNVREKIIKQKRNWKYTEEILIMLNTLADGVVNSLNRVHQLSFAATFAERRIEKKEKVKSKENAKELARINQLARDEGLTYGQYFKKYGY